MNQLASKLVDKELEQARERTLNPPKRCSVCKGLTATLSRSGVLLPCRACGGHGVAA